eukprot:5156436-Prymnesium_polylepis.3
MDESRESATQAPRRAARSRPVSGCRPAPGIRPCAAATRVARGESTRAPNSSQGTRTWRQLQAERA